MKRIWLGIDGMTKQSGERRSTEVAILQAVNGRLVSNGKGKKKQY